MREIRTSGSEGGAGAVPLLPPIPVIRYGLLFTGKIDNKYFERTTVAPQGARETSILYVGADRWTKRSPRIRRASRNEKTSGETAASPRVSN